MFLFGPPPDVYPLNERPTEYSFMNFLIEKMKNQIPLSLEPHACNRHSDYYAQYFMKRENKIVKEFAKPIDYKLLKETRLYPDISKWDLLH